MKEVSLSYHAVVRGEKMRKEYEDLLRRHRAATIIQKKIKEKIAKKNMKDIQEAAIVMQSGSFMLFLAA